MCKRGYNYYGDEKIFIRLKDKNLDIIPFYTPLMLRRDVIGNEISRNNLIIVKKEELYEEKYSYNFPIIKKNTFSSNRCIFILPKWSKDNIFKSRLISQSETFELLLTNFFNNLDFREKLKRVLDIVRYFKIYEITYNDADMLIKYIDNV